jgi:putative ABC transport system permease protein
MTGAVIFRVAVRALMRNKGRALLTALGIIIGIAAVIAVISVGQGASVMIKTQINSMGNNLVMIFPGSLRVDGARSGGGTRQNLMAEDGEAILRECSMVRAMSPVVRSGAQVVYRENDWQTTIQGVTEQYPEVRNWEMAEGAFFVENDVRRGVRVCVLGKTVADELFEGESPVGKNIRIRNMSFRIIGVLVPKGSTAWGQDQDDVIIAPWITVRRVLQKSSFLNVDQLILSLHKLEDLARAKEEIVAILRQRHRLRVDAEDDFTVTDMAEVTETITSVSRMMTLLLTVIAFISLVVGGIGIMNIMLVSVTERTREIGLRMAVGAKRRDIMWQFLIEAVVLAGVGGLIGVGLGILVAKIVAMTNQWPVLIAPSSILLALSFAAGVGIFFGFYPAWRAARLSPIESLRRE